ncbi:MAG TPA: 3-dehydroquinate synthase, partial [Acidimicrobiia bacterium]|nr:3-dehydroquinate synthase [Acidimicrobiia bacterium]
LVAATRLSHRKGLASADLVDRVDGLVRHIGLSPRVPASIEPSEILKGMRHDKKRRQSRLRFVLLKDVGEPVISDDVEDSDVFEVLESMRESSEQAGVAALGPS